MGKADGKAGETPPAVKLGHYRKFSGKLRRSTLNRAKNPSNGHGATWRRRPGSGSRCSRERRSHIHQGCGRARRRPPRSRRWRSCDRAPHRGLYDRALCRRGLSANSDPVTNKLSPNELISPPCLKSIVLLSFPDVERGLLHTAFLDLACGATLVDRLDDLKRQI